MSRKLTSLNRDLERLVNEGYELEFRAGLLLVHAVPYANARREVAFGTIVSELTMRSPDVLDRPSTHQVHFIGEHPCYADGRIFDPVQHASAEYQLAEGVVAQHFFSHKPKDGYRDYYEKIATYVRVISAQARAIDSSVDARTFKVVKWVDDDSVFEYEDTASSRAGVRVLATRLAPLRIAIVGLGGTGSYVLDLMSRTHVAEIHLYDGDPLRQHNAFRMPGVLSEDTLNRRLAKVAWLAEHYSALRRGIVPHAVMVDEGNVAELTEYDHVFLCVDQGTVRSLVNDMLSGGPVTFIDVGLGMGLTPEGDKLWGTCRVTASMPGNREMAASTMPKADRDDDLYRSNIQVVEFNALNAAIAVLKWKRMCGYYVDDMNEYESTFSIGLNQVSNKGAKA